ncbi:MAG: DEAD/DEAH box helicase family protein [candidate division WOR-3 bacterium]
MTLQEILEDEIRFEDLPIEWKDFDLESFSKDKTLFDYQTNALKFAIMGLFKYYQELEENKKEFYKLYKNYGLDEDLDIKIDKERIRKLFELANYRIENNKVLFYQLINRMSFWMATGSGKTLIIVKLIEILHKLMEENLIPEREILFLTHREDLIDQFKKHVNEFNSNSGVKIELYDLKEYENIKRSLPLKTKNTIRVFYYRADLLVDDESKEKKLNYKTYENNGNWYIILDEAHKGDKEDSIRQHIYAIMSRNGFLFNFSATFTDRIDHLTCVYNYNLEKFIQNGYGKNIYISKQGFSEEEKQKIVLKTLLLYTILKKHEVPKYYHTPLLLVLVNKVHTEESDLEMFFKELEKIAKGEIDESTFEEAKRELKEEFKEGVKYQFVDDEFKLSDEEIESLTMQDLLKEVFNAQGYSSIELITIRENKQELILKLKSTEKPFGLIKVGDQTKLLKEKFIHYEITERFEKESLFKNLDTEKDITILMGSRAFYEGWDSTRPNIILYINIGVGKDAKKFVLQSIGRGVRINPVRSERQRLKNLWLNKKITQEEYHRLKDHAKYLETLFVYGTKADNLKKIIEFMEEEKSKMKNIGEYFEINPEIKDKLLLIPTYRETEKYIIEDGNHISFSIGKEDLERVKEYFNYLGEKATLMKYDCPPKVLCKLKDAFCNEEKYFTISKNNTNKDPDLLLGIILKHFSTKYEEFDKPKKLEEEIIHFKHIKVHNNDENKLKNIVEKIEKVRNFPKKAEEEEKYKELVKKGEITINEYTDKIREMDKKYKKEEEEDKLTLKYIQNHYYIPVALSEDEKIDYIKHIIKVKSEVDFIKDLEKYLEGSDNFFKSFDWWYFSKIDETLDDVYIPYYDGGKRLKFKPDFIFWLCKGEEYTILFIDPKSTEFTSAYRKIDGYKALFEGKEFAYGDYKVRVLLFMRNNTDKQPAKKYEEYWFRIFEELKQKVKNFSGYNF